MNTRVLLAMLLLAALLAVHPAWVFLRVAASRNKKEKTARIAAASGIVILMFGFLGWWIWPKEIKLQDPAALAPVPVKSGSAPSSSVPPPPQPSTVSQADTKATEAQWEEVKRLQKIYVLAHPNDKSLSDLEKWVNQQLKAQGATFQFTYDRDYLRKIGATREKIADCAHHVVIDDAVNMDGGTGFLIRGNPCVIINRPKNIRMKQGFDIDPSPAPAQSPTTINNAPGGFAISGGTVVNPTVNNAPPPPPPPVVTFETLSAKQSYPGHYRVVVRMTLTNEMKNPGFAAICDRPCHPAYAPMRPSGGTASGSSGSENGVALYFFDSPSSFEDGTKLDWTLESDDGNPITVQRVLPARRGTKPPA